MAFKSSKGRQNFKIHILLTSRKNNKKQTSNKFSIKEVSWFLQQLLHPAKPNVTSVQEVIIWVPFH